MTQNGIAGKPIDILLVEDNPGDVRLAAEALKTGRIKNQMHVAKDGEEAMDFLLRKGEFANAPRPDLILLDLNLPRKDGREVLAEIKSHPDLRSKHSVINKCAYLRSVLLWKHASAEDCRFGDNRSRITG